MQSEWIATFVSNNPLQNNFYVCNGCIEQCTVEGKDKPTTCIRENLFHEVQD
jgi:hypothetical protein